MARSNQLISLEKLAERKGNVIHPTATVAKSVKLGKGVVIGAYCDISGDVEIGDQATILGNVMIEGRTKIGARGIIHQFCVIGNLSHDLKCDFDSKTSVTIGDDCAIREFTNVHAGTPTGNEGRGTIIGNDVYIMSHSHVAHDCVLADHVLLAQQATLGGEVKIDEHAIIGGCTAIHQFCTVGRHVIVGGVSKVSQDIIPYCMTDGNPASLSGLNLVGLKRSNFPDADIRAIKEVYKTLFIAKEGLWAERVAMARELYGSNPVTAEIFKFLDSAKRVIARPRNRHKSED